MLVSSVMVTGIDKVTVLFEVSGSCIEERSATDAVFDIASLTSMPTVAVMSNVTELDAAMSPIVQTPVVLS